MVWLGFEPEATGGEVQRANTNPLSYQAFIFSCFVL